MTMVLAFWVKLMRPAVASGISAAGTLALAQRILFEPKPYPDWPAFCPPLDKEFNWGSFCLGLLCGLVIFAAVEAFVTARWALISLVNSYLSQQGEEGNRPRLYRFLDDQRKRS